MAEVVALVYGNDQRSAAVQYGGPEAMGGSLFLSYVYHAPWGFTSQGALYALMFRRYMELTGLHRGRSRRGRGRAAAGREPQPERADAQDASRSRTISPRTTSASRCICSTIA